MDIDIKKTLSGLQALGMTQAQIGLELDCSQPAVSDLLSGKIGKSRPSHKIVSGIQALAIKMGVEISYLAPSKSNRTHPTEQQERETEPIGTRLPPKDVA